MVLEDDTVLADQIALILKNNEYEVQLASNSDTFFAQLRTFKPDVILVDVFLVGSRLNGIQVLKYIKENLDFNYKVIVISGEVTTEQIRQIRELGA